MISVIIVLYESADVIEACLRTVPPTVKLVVVDNASSDGGLDVVHRVRPDATCIRAETNRGFGAGCNLGWQATPTPLVAFVNPDVRLRPDTLELLAERISLAPRRLVGPAVRDGSGRLWSCKAPVSAAMDAAGLLPGSRRWGGAGVSGRLEENDPVHRSGGRVAQVEGACFMIRRADLAEIGGFDEDLFLYDEEASLALRLTRRGGDVWYEPRTEVTHLGESSTSTIGDAAVYHRYRSRALLYRKVYGDRSGRIRAALVLAAAACGLVTAIANEALDRPRLLRLPRWRATVRGLVVGARAKCRSDVAY